MPGFFRRKWVRRLLVAAGVFIAVLVGVRAVWVYLSSSKLSALIARIEADDPDWQLDKLTAKRNAGLPPDGQNSFPLAAGVKAKLPASFDDRSTKLYEAFNRNPAAVLGAEDRATVEELLAECDPALADARQLAEMPDGGQPLTFPANAVQFNWGPTQDVRRAASLLLLDAMAAANADKPADAVRSLRALLNVGRAIGDEPTMISQLVRSACVAIARQGTGQVLGLCQPTDADGLDTLQAELLREADFPRLAVAYRGERAITFQSFAWMTSGRAGAPAPTGIPVLDPIARWGMRSYLPAVQHRSLELMTDCLDAARKPFDQQRAAFKAVPQPDPNDWRSMMTRLLLPAIEKTADAGLRTRGELLAAGAAVAAERYRRKTGTWPASLEALVPEFLPTLPNDPFTGQPLAFKRLPDGLVIYTVGPDGKDDGGQVLEAGEGSRVTDYGLRLWDADKRRQPPPPGKPEDKP
jgi:hypothetical protein